MKYLLLLLIVPLFVGCPDNSEPTINAEPVSIAFTQDAQDSAEPLAKDESLTLTAENRDARMMLFRGVVTVDEEAPFTIEFVRTIEGEMHRDTDTSRGPEQWITFAQILDGDGEVLWEDRVNSLFQILLYLEIVLEQTSALDLTLDQMYRFIEMQYPDLLEFGVIIPTGFENAEELVFTVTQEDGTQQVAGRYAFSDLIAEPQPPELDATVKTIVDSGPAADRVDIAIIADGYVAGEEGKFNLDAESIANRLFETEPFKSNKSAFNVHAVFVPGGESGTGYDCTGNIAFDRDCKNDLRDTPFQTTFVISALADQLNLNLGDTSDRVAMPLRISRIFESSVAAQADEVLLLANTSRRSGFAGLYMSVVTAYDSRNDFPHTAVHELGHSFGVLGDEYNVEGDPCLLNEPRISLPVNIAADLGPLKWNHWVEDGTALPTPVGQALSVDVGAYQGAYNCDELYRPSFRCKMNASTDEFCPVCSEQLTRRVFGSTDPIPEGITFTQTDAGLEVMVPETDIPRLYEWSIGETVVSDSGSFTLTSDNVPSGWSEFKLTATVDSEFVRESSDRLVDERTLYIRK